MAQILVVDDDPDIAVLIAHKFREDGHDTVVRADGVSGLAEIRTSHPDLVVLDWMMPGMNGLELCREIRSDTSTATTKVLMLTARGQAHEVDRAVEAGVDAFMQKPFSPRELLARARSLLERTAS